MSSKTHKNANKSSQKGFAGKRTVNPSTSVNDRDDIKVGANRQQEHDRRQGSFEGTGEHARTGNPGHS